MGRWRNHAAALAVIVTAGLAVPALAVTVSDMRAVAVAGEPLRFEIELSDLLDISDKDITITAASTEEHARLGMLRPLWLDQLHFEVVRNEQGQVLARATGPQAAPGQHLSFLVQIGWPGHARLQQVSATVQAATAGPAATASQPLVLPEPVVIPANPSAASAANPAPAPAVTPALPDTTVIPADASATAQSGVAAPAATEAPVVVSATSDVLTVKAGDTLSTLAQSWDADNLSLAQRQQLIRENNPRAFIAGDINRLRAGARLKLPAADAAALSTPAEAAAWLHQAERGESARLARPVAVAASEAAVAAGKPAAADDKEVTLTLVAPAKGDQGRAAGEAGAADSTGEALKTRESLAAAEQTRSRLLAERKALSEKLQGLNARAAEQDARLKVLNERLAAFDQQAEVQAQRGDVKAAMAAAAKKQDGGLSAETWVWIVFAGMILTFILIRLRPDNDAPPKPAPVPEYEEFREAGPGQADADALAQPLADGAALAWAEEPAAEAEEEYDFLTDSEAEAHQTRLDLAQAYIDMKETQPARDLLVMVQQGGTAEQRRLAGDLLRSLG